MMRGRLAAPFYRPGLAADAYDAGVTVLQGMAGSTCLAADAHDARPCGCPVLQAWQLLLMMRGRWPFCRLMLMMRGRLAVYRGWHMPGG